MNVIHGTQRASDAAEPTRPVVTIGNFDGVHLGHRALIDAARDVGQRLGAPTWALTFDPAPRDVLRPDNGVARLQSLDDKLLSLAGTGLDTVVVEPFDRDMAARSPRWFADEILSARLGVAGVVVGWDFRFGARRAGTVSDLHQWLAVPVEQVQALVLPDDEAPVSSSRVRIALQAGQLVEANRLLGRPHEVSGPVVPGDQRGRTLGFPTANVAVAGGLLPKPGVYAVVAVRRDGSEHRAVANLGTRPTFDGVEQSLEVHLLDHTSDLYGELLRVRFVAHLRDERRFDGRDALVVAVRADIERARALLTP